MKRRVCRRLLASVLALTMLVTGVPFQEGVSIVKAEENTVTAEKTSDGYRLKNQYFEVETGKYGQITSLQIVNDLYPTNYVMNTSNAPNQNTNAHQWMGELMLQTRQQGAEEWTESMTSKSASGRKVELKDNKVVVTYENATEAKGVQDYKLTEKYYLEDNQLNWEITLENTQDKALEIGDLGLPLAFNEYWSGGDEIYETRVVDHTFIGKNSSYIYVTRPSGLGKFLVMTPDVETGAGFEYQDHWRTEERSAEESAWCQDQNGWANGLNVYYIHSKVIAKTNRGYLENTSLMLEPGESKTYRFHFTAADNEESMKSILYNEGIMDAVAVPGMAFSKNMPAKMYLHTSYDKNDIHVSIKCPHELGLHEGNPNTVCNMMACTANDTNTYAKYLETKMLDGEQYHIYELQFADMGQNDVVVSYDKGTKETELQFYIMDDVANALNTHAEFMVDKTQWDAEGELYDKVFDDWMMDTKSKRGEFYGYWGWGDDWGLTHGEFIAEKNVFIPIAKEIEAVDEYLDVAIWNGLMQEHQEDYLIHDFLMEEPNTTPTYRGYAYAHIYNTYYSMYKIASKYPNMVTYIEDADTYLLRAYRIMDALYSDGVAYNWETGIMGELTTPDIIQSLKKEGYFEEAANLENIMEKKYSNFKSTKYPYGSEYSYDNTGEEAVYTLAKLNVTKDTENANSMMTKIDAKTRACRGLQPVWYHYADPTTICGENWWNFQYTAALAGYCMDDYLRLQDNGLSVENRSKAERMNYAAKLANLTCINSGQIDADEENIGTASWTYQMEMGNLGGQGTGGGNLHNGWRQMAGEADLGLFGALQILSADVSVDPVFGLFGYGCEVEDTGDAYDIIPLDGLCTRLNLIDEQLYVELDRDKYTKAVVSKDATNVELTIKNLEGTEHDTLVQVTGLQEGAYRILVDGKETGTFKAEKNKASSVNVPLPKNTTAKVVFKSGAATNNTAPKVDVGSDKEVFLPSYDGIDDVTISMEVKLENTQNNQTRLFEFGDMDDNYLYVSFKNGNKIYLTATDMENGTTNTIDTEVQVAAGYWKTVTLTNQSGDISLYIDGKPAAEMKNSGFTFSKLGKVQRNYLGRSKDDSISFLQGDIANFEMYSYAMTAKEVLKKYGDDSDKELVSVKDVTLITPVGEVATFPSKVNGLFSNGLYQEVDVIWEKVEDEKYEEAGTFDVKGTIKNSKVKAVAHVLVVEGEVQNLAAYATPTAVIDTPSDLGGVKGLNDGYEPSSSRDTSHGVWHNWHGDQSGEAWVQYTWDEEMVITSQDAYYFTDGNFAPANVSLCYLNDDGEWIEMSGTKGLGVELNAYNYTSFDAVSTKGIRMIMNPKTLGVGVIEWKVYGYTDKKMLDTTGIKDAIEWADSLQESKISDGWDRMQEALTSAKELLNNAEAEQEELDQAANELYQKIATLKPIDGNMAYIARVETSYVSPWESLDAVKDGELPSSSKEKTVAAYGSWGNASAQETITYKWPKEVTLRSSGLYLWTDGGGILWPDSYQLSYLDGSEWKELSNAEGFGLEEDVLNITNFDKIKTTGLKLTLRKQVEDGNGVGVFEWTAYDTAQELLKEEKVALKEKAEEEETETETEIETETEVETEEETETETETEVETEEETETETETEVETEEETETETETESEVTVEEVTVIAEIRNSEKTVEVQTLEKQETEETDMSEKTDLSEEEEVTGVVTTRLHATVVDDGYPSMTLQYQWEVMEAPTDAQITFTYPNQPISDVSFDKEGTYKLKLTVSDGELSGSDELTVEVTKGNHLPKLLAQYDFSTESIDAQERILKDVGDAGYDSTYSYNPSPIFKTVEEKSSLHMSGGFCGYVKLSSILTCGKAQPEVIKDEQSGNTDAGGGTVISGDDSNDNHNSGEEWNQPQNTANNSNNENAGNTTVPQQTVIPEQQSALSAEIIEQNHVVDMIENTNSEKIIEKKNNTTQKDTKEESNETKEAEPEKTQVEGEAVTESKPSSDENVTETEALQETQIADEATPQAEQIYPEKNNYLLWILGTCFAVALVGVASVFFYQKRKAKEEE